ncbi:hypothetical protein [Frankia sp. Cas3]|uniref:hypothetical protein n=1 Tax=Frankia sp. Cas3 TaxID=3073926 RepID=UPI002AD309F3|nr:hypothetical protein [Frankia sp. Cas3]
MNRPIISSEGLLRLVELVARLRARDSGEGDASWTARTGARPPDPGEAIGGDAVGAAAGAEPPGHARVLSVLVDRMVTTSAVGTAGHHGQVQASQV